MKLLVLASVLSVGLCNLGGWTNQKPTKKWERMLLTVNRKMGSNSLSGSQIKILSVKTQVVSGMNYDFDFTVGSGDKLQECKLMYYSQSWTKTFEVKVDNCSIAASPNKAKSKGKGRGRKKGKFGGKGPGYKKVKLGGKGRGHKKVKLGGIVGGHKKVKSGGRVGGYSEVRNLANPMYKNMLVDLQNKNMLTIPQNGYHIDKVEKQVVAGMNYKYTLNVGGAVCQVVVYKGLDDHLEVSQDTCNVRRKREAGKVGGWSPVTDVTESMFQTCVGATLDGINAKTNSIYRQVETKFVSAEQQVVAGMKYRFTVQVGESTCMNSAKTKGFTASMCPVNAKSVTDQTTWEAECLTVVWEHKTEVLSLKKLKDQAVVKGDNGPSINLGGDGHDQIPHGSNILGGDGHDMIRHGSKILGGDGHDRIPHGSKILGGDGHDMIPHGSKILGGDGHDMIPHGSKILGGDGHDMIPHGTNNHDNIRVDVLRGGHNLDLVAYKVNDLLGGDDHDKVAHGSTKPNILGGDDHDKVPHGSNPNSAEYLKKMLGGDTHDLIQHGRNLLGGDIHDYLEHGKKLLGDDNLDYLEHGKTLLGQGIHDLLNHGKKILGGDQHDIVSHGQKLLGGDNHDFIQHVLRPQAAEDSKVKPSTTDGSTIRAHLEDHKNEVNRSHAIGGGDHDDCHIGMFKDFKGKFNKQYGSPKEEDKRFMTFCDNMRMVKKLQQTEKGSAVYGATKFADLTKDEFKHTYVGKKWDQTANQGMKRADIPKLSSPTEFDWRDHGAVTPVKNQGSCGSCWAFSTTGNIEGQWAIKKGKLLSLSEQELVDCDKLDEGCNGGLPSNAYKEIERLGGLETETEYSYKGDDEKCAFIKKDVKAYINDSVSISSNETEMASWLAANGPISIGINAMAMQFYMGGISYPWKIFCSPKDLDHGVLIVGYGVQDSKPYWIVKNSWGPDWGEKGYYLVYRGAGVCGLNTMCTSAVVD